MVERIIKEEKKIRQMHDLEGQRRAFTDKPSGYNKLVGKIVIFNSFNPLEVTAVDNVYGSQTASATQPITRSDKMD